MQVGGRDECVDAAAAGGLDSAARSTSPVAQRASAATTVPVTAAETRRTRSASSSEEMGNPASMMSTPRAFELPGEPDLFLEAQGEAWGLLAVAERGVKKDQSISHSLASFAPQGTKVNIMMFRLVVGMHIDLDP